MELTTFTLIILINSLVCIGAYIITRYDTHAINDRSLDESKRGGYNATDSMVLGRIGYMLETHLPAFVHKPLISCPTCMASAWSIWFIPYALHSGIDVMWWLPLAVAMAGLNTVLWSIIEG